MVRHDSPTHVLLLILVLFTISIRDTLSNKRILLSDPNYVEHRLSLLETEVQNLKTQLADVTAKYNDLKVHRRGEGAMYVVWGRKGCPNSTLIYSGMTGGGGFENPGGAVEPVCLPHDPLFGNKTVATYYDIMYGSEYVNDNFYGPNTADQDVPCAVCNRDTASQILMIPGRNKCHTGWQEEYHGYLGGNYYNNKRGGKYACIHEVPEFLEGGADNKNGYVFHGVLTSCGSLKCPPYVDHKPVTCVICTR